MTEIRSFRRVFDLERRIYRIDSIRLNPAGIPVRGVAYFIVAVAAMQAFAALPIAGDAVRLVPWYARSLGVPLAAAVLFGLIRVEGRHFHLALLVLVRFAFAGRTSRGSIAGRTWTPSEIVFLPDGSDATLRSLRYAGPGVAVVRRPHRRELRRRRFASRRRHMVIHSDAPSGELGAATPASLAIAIARGRSVTTRRGRR